MNKYLPQNTDSFFQEVACFSQKFLKSVLNLFIFSAFYFVWGNKLHKLIPGVYCILALVLALFKCRFAFCHRPYRILCCPLFQGILSWHTDSRTEYSVLKQVSCVFDKCMWYTLIFLLNVFLVQSVNADFCFQCRFLLNIICVSNTNNGGQFGDYFGSICLLFHLGNAIVRLAN